MLWEMHRSAGGEDYISTTRMELRDIACTLLVHTYVFGFVLHFSTCARGLTKMTIVKSRLGRRSGEMENRAIAAHCRVPLASHVIPLKDGTLLVRL